MKEEDEEEDMEEEGKEEEEEQFVYVYTWDDRRGARQTRMSSPPVCAWATWTQALLAPSLRLGRRSRPAPRTVILTLQPRVARCLLLASHTPHPQHNV
jgi:hypothetical protein